MVYNKEIKKFGADVEGKETTESKWNYRGRRRRNFVGSRFWERNPPTGDGVGGGIQDLVESVVKAILCQIYSGGLSFQTLVLRHSLMLSLAPVVF